MRGIVTQGDKFSLCLASLLSVVVFLAVTPTVEAKATFDYAARNQVIAEEKTIGSQTDGGGSPVVLSHTEYELTSYGQPKKMTEHLGVTGDRVTELIIDGAGRERELHRGDGAESRIERKTSYMVDGSGRMYEQFDAENNSTKFGYGGSARPDPTRLIVDGLSYRMDRDARGRTTRTEQLDGGWAINRSFDKVGDLKGQWLDGDLSNRVNTTYDSLGKVLTRVGETGDETRYGYDADGRILHQDVLRDDGSWERASYGYDAGGRLSSVSYPDGTSETFSYNSDDTIDLWHTRLVNDVGTPLILKHEYDEMGRLTRRYVDNASAFGVVPEGFAPLDVIGEKFGYDDLGRLNLAKEITAIGGPDEDDQYKDFSAVGYGYLPSDSRTLPWTVTTGGSSYWQIVQSSYGIHDVLESLTNSLNDDSVSYSFASDDLNRRKETTPGDGAPINYAWSGLHGLSGMNTGPEGLEVQRHYDLLNLLSSESFLVNSEAAGGFSFDWDAASGWKQKRSKAAEAKLAEGLDWTWSSNAAKRLLLAESSLGNWFFDLGVADELKGVYSPGGIRTTFETGVNGRLTGISTQEGDATTTEALSYDGLGRRIADGREQYEWTWSGRLAGTEVAEYVEGSGGDRVSYVYDATGRLIKRSLFDEFGSFIEAQVFVWNGAELLRQEGLNFLGERLWRAEYLPGPGGLDDSPQIKVTTHMHSSDPEPETTRSFEIVRDEMNSVVAIVERDPAVVILPLKARVLYSPYGKAFLEEGPTLLSVDHEIERRHAGGVSQAPVNFADLDEDGELEPTGIPGALVFDFTYEIDPESLSDGLRVERYTENQWADVEADFAIVIDEEKPSRIVVMPLEPWEHSGRFRIRLDKDLMDTSGRSAVFPEDAESYSAMISIDEILPEEPEKIAGYPQSFPIRFDTAKAARSRLDCGEGIDGPDACFPAGLNMLFQGAYFDPTTGLGYFRARWYDPRTASWLSEDPAGAVDSPNLYAFVGWDPHMYTDPSGLVRYTGHGGVNVFGDFINEVEMGSGGFWADARYATAIGIDTLGNSVSDFFRLDSIADSTAVSTDSRYSTGERVWAGTKGVTVAALDVAGGAIAKRVLGLFARIPGVGWLTGRITRSRGGEWLGRYFSREIKGLSFIDDAIEGVSNSSAVSYLRYSRAGRFLGRDVRSFTGRALPPGVRFNGTVWRYENPGRIKSTWETGPWNIGASHRYSRPGLGATYGGLTKATAKKEIEAYVSSLAGKVPTRRSVAIEGLLDLRNANVRRYLGVTMEDIVGGGYRHTQRIGDWAWANGYRGIIAPSVRFSGRANLVVFGGF